MLHYSCYSYIVSIAHCTVVSEISYYADNVTVTARFPATFEEYNLDNFTNIDEAAFIAVPVHY